MTATTILEQWGKGCGIRLSKALLDEVGLDVGSEVEVTTDGQAITIRPRRPVRGRYTAEQLVAEMPDDPEGGEVDWGPPVGKEVW